VLVVARRSMMTRGQRDTLAERRHTLADRRSTLADLRDRVDRRGDTITRRRCMMSGRHDTRTYSRRTRGSRRNAMRDPCDALGNLRDTRSDRRDTRLEQGDTPDDSRDMRGRGRTSTARRLRTMTRPTRAARRRGPPDERSRAHDRPTPRHVDQTASHDGGRRRRGTARTEHPHEIEETSSHKRLYCNELHSKSQIGNSIDKKLARWYSASVITRDAAARLAELASYYPVVSVTGPRQSGKTTLCRASFPTLPYVSLEPLDVREFATSDPRGFLAAYPSGAIIDEVQRAPDLFSYLQAEVDENSTPGRFILTGSQQLGLTASITQSLAGRTGLLELYPPSWAELKRFPTAPSELFEVLWTGAYPRIFDRQIPPHQWLADYVATYAQRDVRQLLNVGDLRTFTTFLQLCAGSTAGETHLSRLGADAGISHNTAKAWISVLEATYLVFRVPGWHPTFRKQVVKSAKLHFVDTGVASYLLGIREPEQLRTHPLRGALFESWVASELVKRAAHLGQRRELFHYRDAAGLEVDLVSTDASSVTLIEAKSGATIASDFTEGVERLARGVRLRAPDRTIATRVIHGGATRQSRGATQLLPWHEIDQLAWTDATATP
jgi:uncharacterized protein